MRRNANGRITTIVRDADCTRFDAHSSMSDIGFGYAHWKTSDEVLTVHQLCKQTLPPRSFPERLPSEKETMEIVKKALITWLLPWSFLGRSLLMSLIMSLFS